jgi:hypothetical protein
LTNIEIERIQGILQKVGGITTQLQDGEEPLNGLLELFEYLKSEASLLDKFKNTLLPLVKSMVRTNEEIKRG